MLARTKVPINIVSWPDVDGDLKDKLWLDVKDTFKVAPKSKKLVLTSAGTKWRAFKTMLTRKFVLPYLGKKKKLRKPPSKYAFAGRLPWRQFVKERTTEKWLWAVKTRKGYTQQQLDEVRMEVADYLQTLL